MKLTTTRQKAKLPTLSNEPWAIEIRERYKSTQDLYRNFSAERVDVYALNYEKAIESETPSLIRLVKSFGEDVVTPLMEVHLTSAILSMGEEKDVEVSDVKLIASAICHSEKLKTLSMASILRFFYKLKCGEFKIYGKLTPRKILEVMQEYADVAKEKEWQVSREIERKRKLQEYEQHQSQAITFEEYKQAKGYGVEIISPLDLIGI